MHTDRVAECLKRDMGSPRNSKLILRKRMPPEVIQVHIPIALRFSSDASKVAYSLILLLTKILAGTHISGSLTLGAGAVGLFGVAGLPTLATEFNLAAQVALRFIL